MVIITLDSADEGVILYNLYVLCKTFWILIIFYKFIQNFQFLTGFWPPDGFKASLWLRCIWHSSLDYIYGSHGYFRLVFWPNSDSFKAKKIYILKEKSPQNM